MAPSKAHQGKGKAKEREAQGLEGPAAKTERYVQLSKSQLNTIRDTKLPFENCISVNQHLLNDLMSAALSGFMKGSIKYIMFFV